MPLLPLLEKDEYSDRLRASLQHNRSLHDLNKTNDKILGRNGSAALIQKSALSKVGKDQWPVNHSMIILPAKKERKVVYGTRGAQIMSNAAASKKL